MTVSYDIGHVEQSPRSDHGGSSSSYSSPRHSSRVGKSLDMELRNAPCYHAAIMRLLPSSMRRALTLHHPASPTTPAHGATSPLSTPGHRQCLCDRVRDRRQYRKDWRFDHCNTSYSSPRLITPPAPAPCTFLPTQETNYTLPPRICPPLLDTNRSFRSGTVYLEVKLVELLSAGQCKHDLMERTSAPLPVPVPDAHCFGVCWQVPYFELIRKLGHQKVEIEADRENLKTEVLTCQAEIGSVEQNIEVSNQKLEAAESFGREMEKKLGTILDALERILEQVRTLQEEMMQLKRKMQKARVEQAKAHEVQYEQMVRKENYTKLEDNYKSMLQELQEAHTELDVVQKQSFDSVPKEELGFVKAKVSMLQKTLSELQVKSDEQMASSGELTPRPAWEELLFPFRSHEKPNTVELLNVICKHNVYLTHNISQLHEDCATVQATIFEKCHTIHGKLLPEDHEQNNVVDLKSDDK
ncbi:hypothetical protein GOP47_0007743 [Adiantum capillus-veneris]|uniref:Uncharacterized protein n=1 Tax=Adiantum capillus-veneris TaxID=13818 RepID=A0A9D4ZJL1_ADICA|nr:hypothetical protein GOP47_0007743 [Adiantum capillus-veneris]